MSDLEADQAEMQFSQDNSNEQLKNNNQNNNKNNGSEQGNENDAFEDYEEDQQQQQQQHSVKDEYDEAEINYEEEDENQDDHNDEENNKNSEESQKQKDGEKSVKKESKNHRNESSDRPARKDSSSTKKKDNRKDRRERSRSRSRDNNRRSNNNNNNNSNNNNGNRSKSGGHNNNNEQRQVEACCTTCKQNDRMNHKTCVCVVPANQRRTNIGDNGCKNCGCTGCSYEDLHKNDEYNRDSISSEASREHMKNGCCKPCLKAFSENGKACMCQVPNRDRKHKLPEKGCKKCGCHGCHPYDTRLKSDNNSKQNKSHANINSSNRRRSVSQSPEELWNLDNLNKSKIGTLISHQLGILPPLIGFGIPQRTYSYLTGLPDNKQKS